MTDLTRPDPLGGNGGAMSEASPFPDPTAEAIDYLRKNPHLTAEFDELFGRDSHKRHLNVGNSALARELQSNGTLDRVGQDAATRSAVDAFSNTISREWEKAALSARGQSETRANSVFGTAGRLTPEERIAAGEAELATAKSRSSLTDKAAAISTAAGAAIGAIPSLITGQVPGDEVAAAARVSGGALRTEAEGQTKRVERAEKALQGAETLPEYSGYRDSIDRLLRTVADFAIAKPVEFAGILSGYASNSNPGFAPSPAGAAMAALQDPVEQEKIAAQTKRLNSTDPTENPVYQFGKRIEAKAKELFPDDPARQYEFTGKVVEGIGSTAAFGGTGLIVRMLGAGERGTLAAIALSGAAGSVPDEFEKATKAIAAGTATEQDRFINMLANIALGATEAIPFAPAFAKRGVGGLGGAVKRAGEQMVEEATQEIVQQAGTNIAAKGTFDPSRNIAEGVLEGAAVAGITGGAFGAGMSSRVARSEREQEAAREQRKAEVEDIRRRIDEIAGTQEVRPDLPAMAAEKPRTAAEIAKAPSFNDMLAALPKDASGGPDLAPLVERIATYGTNAWGRLTPEQRAEVYQTFKPMVEEATQAISETVGGRKPPPLPAQPQASKVDAAQTAGQQSASGDPRQRFDQVLGSKTRRADWAKAAGVSEQQLRDLIAEAVTDGRLKMVRGQPVRTGKRAPAVQGGTTPAVQPSSSAALEAAEQPSELASVSRATSQGGTPFDYRPGAERAGQKKRGKASSKSQPELRNDADRGTLRQPEGSVPEAGVSGGTRADEGSRDVGVASRGDRPIGDRDVGRDDRPDAQQPADAAGAAGQDAGVRGDTGGGTRPHQPRDDLGAAEQPGSEPGGLTAEQTAAIEADIAADLARVEKLREDRRTRNYQITDADQIGKGGAKAKVRANLEALRVLKLIEDEKRPATEDEKKVLVKYVGWGAFAQDVFASHKDEWAKERAALQNLMTPEEYRSAKASTINAHYTSPEVIKGMWQALSHLGFKGGRVLEPSAGIGHFIGLQPESMRAESDWTAVELDTLSGRITKALYGAADVRIGGFEAQTWPDDHFDLAISNVPFDATGPNDPAYKTRFSLHDYFFVKALDKVRPGGIVAFITSSYSLDKKRDSARREMEKRGTFLGAIRLPGGNQGAFKANAGTDVTTDIIFFRKRISGEPVEVNPAWQTLEEIKTPEGPTTINGYFAKHPEMMLGKMRLVASMYSKGEPVLIGSPQDIEKKIVDAAGNMEADSMTPRGASAAQLIEEVDTDVAAIKEGAFYEKDGKIFRRIVGVGVPQKLNKQDAARVRAFIPMRDIVNEMLAKQARGERAGTEDLRAALDDAYQMFVDQFGPINLTRVSETTRKKDGKVIVTRRYPNFSVLDDDPDAYKVASIEIYDEKTETAAKTAIFTEDIVAPYVRPVATGPADALAVSLNETGKVDIKLIAEQLKMSETAAIRALGDAIYLNPKGEVWETATQYLSGDVRTKLEAAKAAAGLEQGEASRYARNVAALEAVQPTPLTRAEITVPFGASWVPVEVYNAFLEEIVGIRGMRVGLNATTKQWRVMSPGYGSAAANAQWGTRAKSVQEIVEAALNSRPIEVKFKDRDGNAVRDIKAEEEARAKATMLREAFTGQTFPGAQAAVGGWVWNDESRAQRLEAIYNQSFNRIVKETHDGSHLTFPGLARVVSFPDGSTGTINLTPARTGAVWRVIQNGNTLIDHVVGAGKTWTSIMAVMEMKRLGQIRRPMFVVPNHMLHQFSHEFLQAYPGAKLLIATKESMSAAKRREFAAKAAAEKWDGIIITHSAFGRLRMNDDAYKSYYQDAIDQMADAKRQAAADEGKGSPTVKDIEKAKKRLEAKLEKLTNTRSKDMGVTFEELGVDHLTVDEAHLFKNLWFPTRHTRVRGISNASESQRATDLYIKIRHLEKSRPGRSVLFLTGTPLSNTMAEVYTMMRYLQYDTLEQYGIAEFDSWAQTFGNIESKTELAPNGRDFRDTTSFSRFVNIPELSALYGRVADTQTAESLNLPRPKLKGGKPIVVESELSSSEEGYVQRLIREMEALKGKKPQKGDPNFLSLFTKGLQIGTDMRLVDPSAEANPDGKMAKAAANIFKIWQDGNSDPAAPDKAQLVFLDMGVPGSRAARKSGSAVDETQDAESQIEAIRRQMAEEAGQDTEDGDAEATTVNEEDAEAEALLFGKFNLYEDLKQRLIEKGVPAEQIAFIHDAKNDEQKAKIFEAVREGKIRVLLGSSAKMGVGTNVQKRLVALHHIDAPWKPADVEQRDGRILRQGNKNKEVSIYRYVTKRSFDSYRWQILETKAHFIGQFRAGARGVRIAEDIDSPLPEAAELKAAATGNPLIVEHAEKSRELRNLEAQRSAHEGAAVRARSSLGQIKSQIEHVNKLLPAYEADAARVVDLKGDAFKVTLEVGRQNQEVTDRKKAGEALRTYILSLADRSWFGRASDIDIGEISGFRIGGTVTKTPDGVEVHAAIEGTNTYRGKEPFLINPETPPSVLMQRWERLVGEAPALLAAARQSVANMEAQLPKLKQQAAGAPFPKQAELEAVAARVAELTKALKPKTPEDLAKEKEQEYVDQAIRNLMSTSRTAKGVVDTSASAGKADKIAEGLTADTAKTAALENFDRVIRELYVNRDVLGRLPPESLADEIDRLAMEINKGILKEGALYRTDDSPKYPYTLAEDLPLARRQMATELAQRLSSPGADPVETAAWIEWRFNLTDHLWADGVGKTSKALAAVPLMRAGLPLPIYRDNKEFFANANKRRYDPKAGPASYLSEEWTRFLAYYRSLMPAEAGSVEDLRRRGEAAMAAMQSPEWLSSIGTAPSQDTSQMPGYGTPEWKANRRYNTPDGTIVGYDNALIHLAKEAFAKVAGGVRKERQLYILLGMAGSGKSTIAKTLNAERGAAHIVADDAKVIIPEYDGGKNSGGVHEESSDMAKDILKRLIGGGYNLIIEKVGSSDKSIASIAAEGKKAGYEVTLVYLDVPVEVAMERAVARWRNTGRAVPMESYTSLDIPGVYARVGASEDVDETATIRWNERSLSWVNEGTGPRIAGLEFGTRTGAVLPRVGGVGGSEGATGSLPGSPGTGAAAERGGGGLVEEGGRRVAPPPLPAPSAADVIQSKPDRSWAYGENGFSDGREQERAVRMVLAGQTWSISRQTASTLRSGIQDLPAYMLPAGTQPAFLMTARLLPNGRVMARFEAMDGSLRSVELSPREFAGARAAFDDSVGAVLHFAFDAPSQIGKRLRRELWHEAIHALRRSALNASVQFVNPMGQGGRGQQLRPGVGRPVYLDDARFNVLADHALALGVLDLDLPTFMRAIGDPQWDGYNSTRLLQSYANLYGDRSRADLIEALRQEAVAHMTELLIAGVNLPLPENVRQVYEEIESGALARADQGRPMWAMNDPPRRPARTTAEAEAEWGPILDDLPVDQAEVRRLERLRQGRYFTAEAVAERQRVARIAQHYNAVPVEEIGERNDAPERVVAYETGEPGEGGARTFGKMWAIGGFKKPVDRSDRMAHIVMRRLTDRNGKTFIARVVEQDEDIRVEMYADRRPEVPENELSRGASRHGEMLGSIDLSFQGIGRLATHGHRGPLYEVRYVEVGEKHRMRGLAKATYDMVEEMLGTEMAPSGTLLPDGYAHWKKRNPELVRGHQYHRADEQYLSPRNIKNQLDSAERYVREFDREAEIQRHIKTLNDRMERGIADLVAKGVDEGALRNGGTDDIAAAIERSQVDFDKESYTWEVGEAYRSGGRSAAAAALAKAIDIARFRASEGPAREDAEYIVSEREKSNRRELAILRGMWRRVPEDLRSEKARQAMFAFAPPAVIHSRNTITLDTAPPADAAGYRAALQSAGTQLPDLPTVEAIYNELTSQGVGAIRYPDGSGSWTYQAWEPANVIDDADAQIERDLVQAQTARAAEMEAEDLTALATADGTVLRNGLMFAIATPGTQAQVSDDLRAEILRIVDEFDSRAAGPDQARSQGAGAEAGATRFGRALDGVGATGGSSGGAAGAASGQGTAGASEPAVPRLPVTDRLRDVAYRTIGARLAPAQIEQRRTAQGFTTFAWHATHKTFDTPDPFRLGRDFGFHVAIGRPDAANERIGFNATWGAKIEAFIARLLGEKPRAPQADNARIMALAINVQNPLRLPDLVQWDLPGQWKEGLHTENSPNWLRTWVRDWYFQNNAYREADEQALAWNQKFGRDVAAELSRRGYDGIVYRNEAEAKGQDSLLVWDASRVRSRFDAFDDRAVGEPGLRASDKYIEQDIRDLANRILSEARADGPMFAFGGRLAKTADLKALKRAERMKAEGATAMRIWTETGWFTGPDGEWRFEIDDSNAELGPIATRILQSGGSYSTLAGNEFRNPNVYAAYPQLAGADYRVTRGLGQQGRIGEDDRFGVYDPVDGSINVTAYGPGWGRTITMHEQQHAIQMIEGFATGSSPDDAADQLRAARSDLADWDSVDVLNDTALAQEAFRYYHRSAGEVEARLVEKRRNMTSEQRKQVPPWQDYDVPENEQIVRQWMRENDISAMAVRPRPEAMFALADRETGQSMRRDMDALGYVSQALEAARALKQAKGTPEQILAQLRSAGVKQAEIEATNLASFLDGKKSVTRDEIVAHLEQNRVGLRESIRFVDPKKSQRERLRAQLRAERSVPRDRQDAQLIAELESRLDDMMDEFAVDAERYKPKWNKHSLDPSNPTYRETVLHLPSTGSPYRVVAHPGGRGFALQNDEGYLLHDSGRPMQYSTQEDAARRLTQQGALQQAPNPHGDFRFGHFPEPNIIGHMMTSMTRHEGKPVYTIDQIQSDWGQKLRDSDASPERIADLERQIADLDAKQSPEWRAALNAELDSGSVSDRRLAAIQSRWPDETARQTDIRRLQAELRLAKDKSIPGNPLVNTTDQWTTTTLRRAIRQAAEADASYIAIPHGDTVLSYNPGDGDGMRGFYGAREAKLYQPNKEYYEKALRDAEAAGDKEAIDQAKSDLATLEKSGAAREGIVPKNLRKLLEKIDKDAPKPIRVSALETPSGTRSHKVGGEADFDPNRTGFTLFPLTDKIKQEVTQRGQVMFAFAGERAKTADLEALARAKKMTADGVDRTRIWTETGWFLGVDGKWKWEIDDSGLAAQPNAPGLNVGRFDQMFSGSPLTDAYPDLGAVRTALEFGPRMKKGWGEQSGQSISVRGNMDDLRSIGGHEAQHFIQDQERFAAGGSPSDQAGFAKMRRAEQKVITDAHAMANTVADVLGKKFDQATPDEWNATVDSVRRVYPDAAEASVALARDVPALRREVDRYRMTMGSERYNRLAGEVEARAVQKRMNLTPEERRARPPWMEYDVPEDQQIVRFADGSGPMFAMADVPMQPIRAFHGSRADDPFVSFDPNKSLSIGPHFGNVDTADFFSGYGNATTKGAPHWVRRASDIAKIDQENQILRDKLTSVEKELEALKSRFGAGLGRGRSEISRLEAQRRLIQDEMANNRFIAEYALMAEGGRMVPVDLSISNPLVIDDLVARTGDGGWTSARLGAILREFGVTISDDDMLVLKDGDNLKSSRDKETDTLMGSKKASTVTPERAQANALLRQRIVEAGYDAIRYKPAEGNGGDAYIAVKPGTVRSATSGNLMFAMGGVPRQRSEQSIDAITEKLRDALGMTVVQGLRGMSVTRGDTTARVVPGPADAAWQAIEAHREWAEAVGQWAKVAGEDSAAVSMIGEKEALEALRDHAQWMQKNFQTSSRWESVFGTSPDTMQLLQEARNKSEAAWQNLARLVGQDMRVQFIDDFNKAGFDFAHPSLLDHPKLRDKVRQKIRDRLRAAGVPITINPPPRGARVSARPNAPRGRFGNTWIGRGIRAQYDNYSGVARMRSVRQLDEIAHEGAHHLERLFGAELLDLQYKHAAELSGLTVPGVAETPSEQWAEFFRLYVVNPGAARVAAPNLYQGFEDMLEAEMPGMLDQMAQIHDMVERYNAMSPLDQVSSDLVTSDYRSVLRQIYGSYRDGTLKGDIGVFLSQAYTATYDRLNPIAKYVQRMLDVADQNGVRGRDGKPLSLRADENPYKRMRAFAGSYKKGHNWLIKGIRDIDDTQIAPPLRDALLRVFGERPGVATTGAAAAGAVGGAMVAGPLGALAGGVVGSAAYSTLSDLISGGRWDAKRYQDFNAYIFAVAALERYRQYEEKMAAVAEVNAALSDAAEARPALADRANREAAMLERRQTAMVRLTTLMRDRRMAAQSADTALRNAARTLDTRKDDLLAAQMARDDGLTSRRETSVRDAERDQARLAKEADAAQQELAALEIQQAMLASEIEQMKAAAGESAQRVADLDGAVEQLRAARKRELGEGIHRPPVLEPKEKLQATVAEAEGKYPQFVEASRIFHEYVHGLLIMEYRAGFHTREQFEALSKNKAWYAPLMRDLSDVREARGPQTTGGGRKWQTYQALKGSDRAVINPVDIIIERSYQLARKTAYDAAVKTMVDLTRRVGPGGGAIAEEVERTEVMAATQDAFNRIMANATALGLDEEEARQLLHLMEHETTGSDLQMVFGPAGKVPKALRIPYWEDGERKMLQINDADFAQEIFDAVNGIGEDMNNWFIKGLAAPSRWLSFGVTAHPAFAIVNMARDMMAAWITTGATPFLTQAKGIAMEMSTHKFFDSRLWRAGSPQWVQRKVDEWEDFVRKYHESGGIRGGQFAATLGDVKDRGDYSGLRESGFHISLKRIWDLIELAETSTRLGVARMAYKRAKAYDPTLSETEAFSEAVFTARDVLDFDRKGSMMAPLTRVVAFLNPNLQGMDKAVRSAVGMGDRGSAIKKRLQIVMKRDAGIELSANEERDLVDAYKFWFRLAAFNAGVIAIYMLHAGDPEEEEITDKMKESHVMLDVANIWRALAESKLGQAIGMKVPDKVDPNWKRAPLPFELATPAVIGIWALRTHADKDPDSYQRLYESLYGLLAPPAVPQIAKLIYEPAANYSSFSGRPIVSQELQKLRPEERAEWFTSSIAKRIGHALNVAPVKVDYVITNGLGYIGREIQRFGEWVLPEGRQRPGQDESMLTKRVKADPYKSSNAMAELYKQMRGDGGGGGPPSIIKGLIMDEGVQYVQAAAGYKRILDEQNPLAAKAWAAKLPDEQRAYAYLQNHFSQAMRNMHPMNRLDQVVQVVNRMQREIVNGELKDAVSLRRRRNLTLDSILKPTLQDEEVLLDILNRVKVSEARNTFIAIGHGRWGAGAKPLPTDLVLDELKAANSAVYDELVKRIQLSKVPPLDGAAKAWAKAKPDLLKHQEEATLADAVAELNTGSPQIGTREERQPAKVRIPAR